MMSGMAVQPTTAQPQQFYRGIVKQVLSGDSVIIRGQPKGGPPPERQVNISNISSPRLARRNKNEETKDEPWAWEAREYLRKELVGRDVFFTIDYKVPTTGREYGRIFSIVDNEPSQNITEAILLKGLVAVRRESKTDLSHLILLEEEAKSKQLCRWGLENELHIRDVIWQVDNPRALVDKLDRKSISAVIEHVRDGSTVRAFLLLPPAYHYVTIMISGIRAPGVTLDQEGKPDPNSLQPFSEESRYFTESRLLQREVQVVLESVNNQNFVGSIIHPNGDIAELLLKEGFAKCMDWSMGVVTGGAEKLRAAEKFAKEKKLRIWKDYQFSGVSSVAALKGKDKEFIGTVIEIVNADSLKVKLPDGSVKKIFLASVRPPRMPAPSGDGDKTVVRPKRPLYEVPFMYEAREFLRKKLIGKKVHVTVDYVQPASTSPEQNFPEKICCTVKTDGINVGEALLSKGLATVLRHRQDDDQRASDYDSLLAAEAKAQKSSKGLYAKKQEQSMLHVVDLTGDATKAKQYLPYIQRAGKTSALVEFVASGSRLRLFVPREMRLITLLLGGISCPRACREDIKTGVVTPAEPWGDESLAFTKELCLQREVEIEVESSDKAGNFVGWLWVDGRNLSVALVEEALASVHFSAERSSHFRSLQIAEDNAKARREKMWLNYEEPKNEVKPEDDRTERKVDPKHVIVTEVTQELHVFVQFTNDGDKLEALMNDLRRELIENPPLTGAYTPQKGALCVARYSADGEWYRARVEKELPNKEVSVLFVDYGNREKIKAAKCAAIPNFASASLPAFAKEYILACVILPSDDEYATDALNCLKQDTADGKFELNFEYKVGNLEYVTLINENTKEDVGQNLVRDGYLLVENRRERRLQKLIKEYKTAERDAQTNHRMVWRYGDITEDDAREFGMALSR